MFGQRFEKELAMINKALATDQGEKDMKAYMTPFVNSVIDQYIIAKHLVGIPKDDLIQAGWTHFRLALKRYRGRAELMLKRDNEIYYFSTYFHWYIRQGLLEYLKSR